MTWGKERDCQEKVFTRKLSLPKEGRAACRGQEQQQGNGAVGRASQVSPSNSRYQDRHRRGRCHHWGGQRLQKQAVRPSWEQTMDWSSSLLKPPNPP